MTVGTKSVLFGVHCFLLHPLFVAVAWWKLFGFPKDFRLWLAFFVHDLGYWGKPNMDGPEGETHVLWGANLMYKFFGHDWWEFCAYHSRYWSKKNNHKPSRLCVADKLAIVLTPAWLFLIVANLSGEIHEYMALAKIRSYEMKYTSMQLNTDSQRRWFNDVKEYLRRWVAEHKDGREDSWTPKISRSKI